MSIVLDSIQLAVDTDSTDPFLFFASTGQGFGNSAMFTERLAGWHFVFVLENDSLWKSGTDMIPFATTI